MFSPYVCKDITIHLGQIIVYNNNQKWCFDLSHRDKPWGRQTSAIWSALLAPHPRWHPSIFCYFSSLCSTWEGTRTCGLGPSLPLACVAFSICAPHGLAKFAGLLGPARLDFEHSTAWMSSPSAWVHSWVKPHYGVHQECHWYQWTCQPPSSDSGSKANGDAVLVVTFGLCMWPMWCFMCFQAHLESRTCLLSLQVCQLFMNMVRCKLSRQHGILLW